MNPRWLHAFLFAMPLLWAGVDSDTSINDVFKRGNNELAGSITLTVTDDTFSQASADNPFFIRYTTDHQTALAETLVDLGSSNSAINQPIFLAMRLDGLPETSINALPDAVSIVRWVAGESEIWIRIQESSDTWLMNGGPQGPDQDNDVSWNIGTSARISDTLHFSSTMVNGSSLPFNTRDITATEGDFHLAVSTLICMDFSGSSITSDGTTESLLHFDPIIYDESADRGNGMYDSLGAHNTGIGFSNDFTIARGKDRLCQLDDVQILEGTTSGGALYTHTRNISLNYFCGIGGNYLYSEMGTGSTLTISAQTPGIGFPENGARFTVAGREVGSAQGVASSIVNIGGFDLYTELELIWTDTSFDFNIHDLSFELDIQFDPNDLPTALIDFSLLTATHDGGLDSAPYDGIQQNRRCDASLYLIPGETIDVNLIPYVPLLSQWPDLTILELVPLVGRSQ